MKKQKRATSENLSIVRDGKALLFPLSAIKLGSNVRDKLENIEELAASIKSNGLIQALIITKVANGYELIAGQRRLAALKLLGEKSAPVRVVAANSRQVATMRLVENLQRDELSGWETCKAIHVLLPDFKTQRELAIAIGKSEGFVSRCIAVVNAKPELARVQTLSLRELFTIYAKGGSVRKLSGAVPGGRFVDGAIQLKNLSEKGKFTLKINFDPERTPAETRVRIVETLLQILSKLDGSSGGDVPKSG